MTEITTLDSIEESELKPQMKHYLRIRLREMLDVYGTDDISNEGPMFVFGEDDSEEMLHKTGILESLSEIPFEGVIRTFVFSRHGTVEILHGSVVLTNDYVVDIVVESGCCINELEDCMRSNIMRSDYMNYDNKE